jgi:hypothetical protein
MDRPILFGSVSKLLQIALQSLMLSYSIKILIVIFQKY